MTLTGADVAPAAAPPVPRAATLPSAPAPSSAPVPSSAPARRSALSRSRRPRDPWLDNARLVAAVGVVVGHCLSASFARVEVAEPLWAATWPFRLPALVLMAGWFSSSAPLTRRTLGALVARLLVVLVVFDLLSAVLAAVVPGSKPFDPLVPGFGLWFLLALLCWRLALPLLSRVPYLAWWAVGAALLVGLVDGVDERAALSRTIVWFPLFLLGHALAGGDLRGRVAGWRGARTVAVLAAVAVAVTCVVLVHAHGVAPLRLSGPYPDGDLPATAGSVALRALVLLVGVVGAASMLALVPRRRIKAVTVVGAGSLSVYLLHVLALPPLVAIGVFDAVDTTVELLAVVVVAVAVALVLGSPWVRRAAVPLLEPVTLCSRRGGNT